MARKKTLANDTVCGRSKKSQGSIIPQAQTVAKIRRELDAERLLHELQIHKSELEMQNEELRQAMAELRVKDKDLQLADQQLQHAQKLESLGVLAGGIAHDFNNILAVIAGNCSLARMDAGHVETYLSFIEKAVERAAELCRQMLAYAGKAQMARSNLVVPVLVEEVVSLLKTTMGKNVAIKTTISPDVPPVFADSVQLRQVIMNLVMNAVESIGEAHGEVGVSVSTVELGSGPREYDYFGSVIAAGRYICLEVTDNGCGMDEETVRRVFEPFFTTKFAGRGLGMSVVMGMLKAHAAALQCFSALNQGSTFRILIPAVQCEPVVEETRAAVSASWKGSGTVLVVEDEEDILPIVKSMLTALGFQVIEATNGKEALIRYRKHAGDITLVLTDMGMPVMGGRELCEELKKMNPEMPIIITSGFGEAEIITKFSSLNVAGMISKPYSFDRLKAVLHRVLDLASPQP